MISAKEYYANGNLSSEYTRNETKILIKVYYETGELYKIENRIEHTWDFEIFYKNGNHKYKYTRIKGLFNGEHIEYYESGKLQRKCIFKNNRRVEPCIDFKDE